MPAVSVVMNCRNGARYLDEALDSVYAQTFADWEIVFWDNASGDESAAIARRRDARLRYFRSDEALSLGAARNRALEQCRGELVAFLDTDDLWLPRKLELQQPLFADPEVGLAFSNCVIFDEQRRERLQFAGDEEYATGRCFDRLLSSYFLAIPTVVVRKSALGPRREWFDESFHVSEEVDVFLRLAYRWKLAMRPEALAKYRVHSASETWNKSDLFLAEACAMLEKYRHALPQFERHAEAARRFEDRARYASAVFRWRSGDGVHAREQLARLREQRLKTRLLWAASFVPFGIASPLLRALGKILPA